MDSQALDAAQPFTGAKTVKLPTDAYPTKWRSIQFHVWFERELNEIKQNQSYSSGRLEACLLRAVQSTVLYHTYMFERYECTLCGGLVSTVTSTE